MTSAPFVQRHVGPSARDARLMLDVVEAGDLGALIDETVPEAIRDRQPIGLGPALTEDEALERLRQMAALNRPMTSLIGQGYHGTVLPGVIQRNVLENPAWYTAYTPYQPEISQGRLEALLNFQTLVAELTGLDIANASLLDEATAAAEAMAVAQRSARTSAGAFFVDQDCHPQTLAVLRTRAEGLGWRLVVGDPERDLDPAEVFGALLQYPGTFGDVRDHRAVIEAVHAAGGLVVMAADPMALVLLTPPGELGADMAIGSMQRFGVPMGYGGPHAAYIAVREPLKRALPGRLVGVSVDARGKPAYRLALQTREQHIRREKATSNICTAQALLAIIAGFYAVYHGPEGLMAIAERIHGLTARLAAGLVAAGFKVRNAAAFDTLRVECADADAVHGRAMAAGMNLRRIDETHVGVSLDETSTAATVAAVLSAFTGAPATAPADAPAMIPEALRRGGPFLQHPVFHRHRSETEMLRYLRRLADKDLALDRTMIPLGSCTMKLNATTEMLPITWPAFANLHPFAPADQAQGYAALFEALERGLCAVTGYDAVSLQPNSGAQGEYAGLMAIRAYHRSRGEAQRTVCLIPASAHGTNPASAQLAGMEVRVVACDQGGNVDLADLDAKIAAAGPALAAMMITYPSTYGVFEETIGEICDRIHAGGGQVYLDGANLNAQVGLARPGLYGADVSHLNLHKTFCIPHGGGGPGMGPIGVRSHLAPFLPGRPETGEAGAVSAAPYGSASILPIPYAYMLMMGDEGLKRASEVAILNANYVAERLGPYYPILYRGARGRVAHECILDLRPLRDRTGVTVDDVAKRLMDHGMHAPTVSFPVAGALMVEPTESEGLAELDRFCDAMIAIRQEIEAVERGALRVEDSPLRHAPHTAEDLVDDGWDRPYGRRQGCLPPSVDAGTKYWPPVNRIDQAWGDRNLICSCPSVESYQAPEAADQARLVPAGA